MKRAVSAIVLSVIIVFFMVCAVAIIQAKEYSGDVTLQLSELSDQEKVCLLLKVHAAANEALGETLIKVFSSLGESLPLPQVEEHGRFIGNLLFINHHVIKNFIQPSVCFNGV